MKMGTKTQLAVKLGASLAISILLVAALLSWTPVQVEQFAALPVNWWVLLTALPVYALVLFFRTCRFCLLQDANRYLPSANLFKTVMIHSGLVQLLPFRIADAAYPFLVRQICDVSLLQGAYSVVLSRLLDFMLLLSLFVISVAETQHLSMLDRQTVLMYALAALAALLMAVSIPALLHVRLGKVVERAQQKTQRRTIRRVLEAMGVIIVQLGRLRSPRFLSLLLAETVCLWTAIFGMYTCIFWGFGHDISFFTMVIGVSGLIAATVLPVGGLGNVGSLEAGWTLSLVLAGFAKTDAVILSFAGHAVILAVSCCYLLAGLLTAQLSRGHKE